MYSNDLPACPIKQVTKLRDGAFLSVMDTQHLFVGVRGRKRKKNSHVIIMV
jgi:hypothetical protein